MPAARSRGITTAICFWLALVGVCATAASAASPPELYSGFGPDGSEATGFEAEAAGSIAIDLPGSYIYVADVKRGSIFKFHTVEETGEEATVESVDFAGSEPYLSGNELGGLDYSQGGFNQLAINADGSVLYTTDDTGESLHAFTADGEPSNFGAGPGSGTNEIGGFTNLFGVAVDADGRIYAASGYDGETGAGQITIYEPSGEFLNEFSVPDPANIAVDGNGAIYVQRPALSVLKYVPSSFPVTGATTYEATVEPFDPQFASTVAVDPSTNDVYVAHPSEVLWYDENGVIQATIGQGNLNLVKGIGIAGSLVFLSDTPISGLSQVKIFGPEIPPVPEAPSVKGVFASGITASSAKLGAKIDPNLLATEYRFEYGEADCSISVCKSVPVDGGMIGPGTEFVPVSQQIAGLLPDTTYHYRVVAENEEGDNLSEEGDHVFTTQGSNLDFKLGDSRVWEMVSPPNKRGANLVGADWGHIQAGEDGNEIAYLSQNSVEVDPQGNRILEPSTVLGRRIGNDWKSEDIASPNEHVTPLPAGQQAEFKLFSPDLGSAILEPLSGTPLSSEASERTPYLRQNTSPPTYTPLVTGKEGFANVPPGTEFGGVNVAPNVRLQAATSDLSHVVIQSQVPLALGAPERSLYRWSAGELAPINVLPDSEGGGMAVNPLVGSYGRSVRHAISEDGSWVFWSNGSEIAPDGLYLRDVEGEESARLDLAQPGASEAGAEKPVFQGASADGTIAFFTDSQQLTSDASDSGIDLYRCEIEPGNPSGGCSSLIDLSVAIGEPGEDADVQGVAPMLTDDGSVIFFVARGVLDAEPNGSGSVAQPGGYNLYRWDDGGGARFIAALSVEDSGDWGGIEGSATGSASMVTAAGSPNGRYLAFMSVRGLTGQATEDPESGEAVKEVFQYDAQEDQLRCLSCMPSGAAPEGQVLGGKIGHVVDPLGQLTGRRVAAIVPGPTITTVSGISLYRSRSVLDNGRVFFNAFDPLVSGDSNGNWDVYQYEPLGTGDCTATSAGSAVARSGVGCVGLVSSGSGEGEAGFFDASASGNDVFFVTPARLSAIDSDQEMDLYDARVNGTPQKPPVISECAGEACQPFTGAPNDPTPASAAFRGHGNVSSARGRCPRGSRALRRKGRVRCAKRCPRGTRALRRKGKVRCAKKRCPRGTRALKRKGKVRCVPRKKHKRHGRHKRAGHNRRAGR